MSNDWLNNLSLSLYSQAFTFVSVRSGFPFAFSDWLDGSSFTLVCLPQAVSLSSGGGFPSTNARRAINSVFLSSALFKSSSIFSRISSTTPIFVTPWPPLANVLLILQAHPLQDHTDFWFKLKLKLVDFIFSGHNCLWKQKILTITVETLKAASPHASNLAMEQHKTLQYFHPNRDLGFHKNASPVDGITNKLRRTSSVDKTDFRTLSVSTLRQICLSDGPGRVAKC